MLQKNTYLEVFTTPCVGDSDYLKKQFLEVEKDENQFPTIIDLEKNIILENLMKSFFRSIKIY